MHSGVHFTNALPPTMGFLILPYLINHKYSGPIQWARGDVGLKPSAAARPGALAGCEWHATASGLKLLRLQRAWSPGMGKGGDWLSRPRGDRAKGIPRF